MASGQIEATLIASQQAVSSDSPATQQPQTADGILFLIPLTFVLVWSIATGVFIGLPKIASGKRRKVKAGQKIPCSQCQFFTNNPYLRCAVRPETVLTEAASNCSDFQAQPQPAKKAVARSQR